jgi:hypothetical protein
MYTRPLCFFVSLPSYGKAKWRQAAEKAMETLPQFMRENLLARLMEASIFFPPADGGGLPFYICPASLSNLYHIKVRINFPLSLSSGCRPPNLPSFSMFFAWLVEVRVVVVVVAWWANGGGCSLAELRLSPTIFILPC